MPRQIGPAQEKTLIVLPASTAASTAITATHRPPEKLTTVVTTAAEARGTSPCLCPKDGPTANLRVLLLPQGRTNRPSPSHQQTHYQAAQVSVHHHPRPPTECHPHTCKPTPANQAQPPPTQPPTSPIARNPHQVQIYR